VRDQYPILRQTQALGFVVALGAAVTPQAVTAVWNFTSRDRAWTVSISDESASLQTTQYTSRDDFFRRLEHVVRAVNEVGDTPIVDRLGVRYTNQLVGDALPIVGSLIRPELQAGLVIPPGSDAELQLTLTDALFSIGSPSGPNMRVRSGLLPPNAAVDPGTPPRDETNWLLDFDCYIENVTDLDSLGDLSRDLATRIYRFFRWAVTDRFLSFYGEPK
jgi:uncharacterized protein (TIGR04255 family)